MSLLQRFLDFASELSQHQQQHSNSSRGAADDKIDQLCSSLQSLNVQADQGSSEIVQEVFKTLAPSPEPPVSLPSPPTTPISATPQTPLPPAHTPTVSNLAPVGQSPKTSSLPPYVLPCYRYFLSNLHNPSPPDHIRELIGRHTATPRHTIDLFFTSLRSRCGWDTLFAFTQQHILPERVMSLAYAHFVLGQTPVGSEQLVQAFVAIKKKAQHAYYQDVVCGQAHQVTKTIVSPEAARRAYPSPERSPEPVSRATLRATKRTRSDEDDQVSEEIVSNKRRKISQLPRRPKAQPEAKVEVVEPIMAPLRSNKRSRNDLEDDVPQPQNAKKARKSTPLPLRLSALPAPKTTASPMTPPSPPVLSPEEKTRKRRVSESQTSFALPTIVPPVIALSLTSPMPNRLLRSTSLPSMQSQQIILPSVQPQSQAPQSIEHAFDLFEPESTTVSSPSAHHVPLSKPPSQKAVVQQQEPDFVLPGDGDVFANWFHTVEAHKKFQPVADSMEYRLAQYYS